MVLDNECGLDTTVKEGSRKTCEEIFEVTFVIYKDYFGSLVEKRTGGDKYENGLFKCSFQY